MTIGSDHPRIATANTGSRLVPFSSLAAHPVTIFVGIWTAVFLLYSLELSGQLIYRASDFTYLYVSIVGAFLAGYWYIGRLLTLMGQRRLLRPAVLPGSLDARGATLIWRRLMGLMKIWGVITAVEIVVSGGLPIVWLVTGSDKTYRDFGIPSLHGFLISMLLACAMASFLLFLETKRRRYLALPLFALAWFIISVTRAYFIALLFQMLFLHLTKTRLTAGRIARIVVGLLLIVVIFGYLGDIRSGGSDLIRAVGKPSDRFPDWLPTGFLWVYIYLATPLNNLFNTILLNPAVDTFTLAATTFQLFPTFVRALIFPPSLVTQGDLVDSSLNISTSFAAPYTDMGLLGIVLFSGFFGCAASFFWFFRRNRAGQASYAFVAQSLALSVFFSFLLALPFLFQIVWFRYLLAPTTPPLRATGATAPATAPG